MLRDLYRIESVLGAGGYALTYLGSHKGLDQKVAIKEYMPDQIAVREQDHLTLRPRADSDDDYERGLRRFAKEARTLAKFRHPGIVPVTDIFEENGTAYMVMEYVEGESLHQHLGRVGTLVEPAFRAIFDPILEALAEVHANGILHRDIKPANIYVRADGSPVLLDFGNSREALGTKAQSLTVAL
ncbi:MAG TPA: serine/threonine-protein kinase, partial [Alphaproteobacteria bacterium]|nr:serine/threonine-protein kinase [Alphaproteobacteria bacterium]